MKTRIIWIALNLFIAGHAVADQRDVAAVANAVPSGVSTPNRVAWPDFTTLVRREGPAVVNIFVFKLKAAGGEDGNATSAPPPVRTPRVTGSGSGFVVAPNGVILTNSHVVAGASKISVRFTDKRELPARVVGVDTLTDMAVLKVEAENLPSVTLGDSSRLAVGQWVLAIGAPLGLERTATQGIISALGRALPSDNYVPFIQTDVPINPGNSGGPLFDLDGRVIGINSQIVSSSGGYMGLSFAIPINTAVAVAKQILAEGHATHGWLGASAQELSQELATAYGLEAPRGALLTEIMPTSPAAKAGLQPGDIILAMDDIDILDSPDLPPRIGASLPGSKHVMTVLRDGRVGRIDIRIGELGADGQGDKPNAPVVDVPRLGMKLADIDEATRQVLGLHGGVLVGEVAAGPAAAAGLQPGDIVLKIGRFQVLNVAQVSEFAARLEAEMPVPILVKRQDSVTFLTITLPSSQAH